jgi:hypothetical protein
MQKLPRGDSTRGPAEMSQALWDMGSGGHHNEAQMR